MSRNTYYEEIGFFDAFFGLITHPGETTQALLGNPDMRPRHAISLLFTVFLVAFGPVLYYVWRFGVHYYKPTSVYCLALIFFFCIMLFVLFEGLTLAILGIEITISQLFASVAYCLTPLVMVLLLIYLFNYFNTGTLSILSLILNSSGTAQDKFLRVVPYAVMIAQLNVFLVFSYALKSIGDLHILTALSIGALSIVPFFLSLVISLRLAELAIPGSKQVFMDILSSPAGLLAF